MVACFILGYGLAQLIGWNIKTKTAFKLKR